MLTWVSCLTALTGVSCLTRCHVFIFDEGKKREKVRLKKSDKLRYISSVFAKNLGKIMY